MDFVVNINLLLSKWFAITIIHTIAINRAAEVFLVTAGPHLFLGCLYEKCIGKIYLTKMFQTNLTKEPEFLIFNNTATKSSRPEVFCKNGVLKSFAKFTGKIPCRPEAATLLKKRLWHRCFHENFAKFLRNLFCRTPPVAASEHFELNTSIRIQE